MAHTHEQPAGHLPGRPGHEVGLYARVFAVNAAILVLIFCVFVFTPLSVNPDPTRDQVYVLVGGLVLMLAANAVLLRVSLSPLRRLAELMGTVDVLRPGARLQATGSSEVTTVITAFNATLARLEAERQASTRRVITAQEAERRRIAQELHDQIGQNLTAVMLELKRAQSMPAKDADDAVAEAVELARESLEELHRISYRLRPLVLDDLGLVSALAALCEGVSQHTGMAVRTDLDQPATPLHPEHELAVYRVAQEALTNAARHAGSSQVRVTLANDSSGVVLTVADDGCGISGRTPATGGLRGMRERALMIGAALTIANGPQGGLVVTMTVPA